MTLNMKGRYVTISINDTQNYNALAIFRQWA